MSYTLFSLLTRRAKKAHRCIWCGEAIEAGALYQDERSVFYDNLQHHRWHPECHTAASAEWDAGEDNEFSAYENERPTE